MPAGDGIWVDRLVFVCAMALDYIHGNSETNIAVGKDKAEWTKLNQWADNYTKILPPCFTPIFSRDADHDRGDIFPEVWFEDSCHAVGIAHLEIAKLRLTMRDPARPKCGPEKAAAEQTWKKTTRKTVLRICGIALHNRRWPYLFVCATMAIAVPGGVFHQGRARRGGVTSYSEYGPGGVRVANAGNLQEHDDLVGGEEVPSRRKTEEF
ncbi:hypothetical protein BJY00DRAFT_312140 [Aspergillus carlsbadensis]|nr:hypothetical protein BJY00DRAFT_312140 [Aspergillus carlsbadensis]